MLSSNRWKHKFSEAFLSSCWVQSHKIGTTSDILYTDRCIKTCTHTDTGKLEHEFNTWYIRYVANQCCGSAFVSMRTWSGSSFLSQSGSGYGSGSGSMMPNQCGSRRIRILVRLLSHKKLNFYMENIQKVGNSSKNIPYLRRYISLLERPKTRFICKVWSISMLLDPDPDSQINADPQLFLALSDTRLVWRRMITMFCFETTPIINSTSDYGVCEALETYFLGGGRIRGGRT